MPDRSPSGYRQPREEAECSRLHPPLARRAAVGLFLGGPAPEIDPLESVTAPTVSDCATSKIPPFTVTALAAKVPPLRANDSVPRLFGTTTGSSGIDLPRHAALTAESL